MENKEYTTKQEQLARFAKAMGHPARVAILEFLAKQDTCPAFEGVERSGADTGGDRDAESEILHQSGELEGCFRVVCGVFWAMCVQKGKLLRLAAIFCLKCSLFYEIQTCI